MMKHQKLFLIVLFLTLAILACQVGDINLGAGRTVRGSGDVVEETRTVSGVSGVNLATLGHLFIEVGDTESFRIEAEENLMEYLETEVRNGKLRIETQNNINLRNTRPVNYYLTVTELDTIEISSSGNIEAPDLESGRFSITISSSGNLDMGDLEADSLTVVISSSGNVEMGVLNANTLEVNISSSGNLDISGGQVETQNVTINSSGNYMARELESAEAEVRLNSNGSATIWVGDHLRANLNSSGNLRYRGNPMVDATTSSSGDVIHIGE
jgi:hypothetical protein